MLGINILDGGQDWNVRDATLDLYPFICFILSFDYNPIASLREEMDYNLPTLNRLFSGGGWIRTTVQVSVTSKRIHQIAYFSRLASNSILSPISCLSKSPPY